MSRSTRGATGDEPAASVDPRVRARFVAQRRADTSPETALRSVLHRSGLRYRVQYPVPGLTRRRIDIALPGRRLAVFVDGCFWHGCPEHFVAPKANAERWLTKIDTNRARDRDTTRHLEAREWAVVRVWEHVPPSEALAMIKRHLAESPGRRAHVVGPT